MFDIVSEFSHLPDDPTGVCAVLESFVNWWIGSIASTDGYDLRDIDSAEATLRVTLPAALRWLYGYIGKRDDLLRRQDHLRELQSLRVDDNGVLIFRQENEFCAQWGTPIRPVSNGDFPVLWSGAPSAGVNNLWRPYHDRLSIVLLELVMSESMLSHGRNVLHREASSDDLNGFPVDIQPLPAFDHLFWPNPDGPEVKWFGYFDGLVRLDGDAWLWLYARTSASLDAGRRLLPGDWEQLDV